MLPVGRVRIYLGPFLDPSIRKKGPRPEMSFKSGTWSRPAVRKVRLLPPSFRLACLRRRRRRWTLVALAYITEGNEGGEEERERESR